jgi:2-polyprenyl-3-methyl-5-hydroxy-6-metoxy-1,4-benzoquinol methylase
MNSSPNPTSLQPTAGFLEKIGLVRTRFGHYEASLKPAREELETYYRDNYYQVENGSYQLHYDEEELAYIRGQVALRHRLILSRGWLVEGPGSLLDVGCGEGHSLKYFSSQGWTVNGLDFSRDGCERNNPDCCQWLTQGDVFENIGRLIAGKSTYDMVMLDNVLEHVLHPLGLLQDLHTLVKPGGVLVVEVPNDFSMVQMTALNRGWIDRPYWVDMPEHLSYFNADSLRAICGEAGWTFGELISDFPIDWFLANPNSNYIAPGLTGTGKGSQLGKGAHRARIALDNLMRETDPDRLIELYASMARMGVGRTLLGFFRRL